MKNLRQSNRFQYAVLLIVSVLFAASVHGQSKKTRPAGKSANQTTALKEQTSFSSEGKILSSVELPLDILRQLAEYDGGELAKCQQDEFTRQSNAAKHFAASKVNLDGDRQLDLIVQAQTPCFMGAHNTTFWIFTKRDKNAVPNYQLTFDIAVDFLKILKTSVNGYRDIETASHTAVELSTIIWKFDGRKYQRSECRLTNLTTNKVAKIKCNL